MNFGKQIINYDNIIYLSMVYTHAGHSIHDAISFVPKQVLEHEQKVEKKTHTHSFIW